MGAAGPAADAEMCMMMADTMDSLGLGGEYIVRVNSRRALDGILDTIGLAGVDRATQRLRVLRSLDKFDRLGADGVRYLLMNGRTDESGDFSEGAHLDEQQVELLLTLLNDQFFAFLLLPNNLRIHESQTYEEYLQKFEPDDPTDWGNQADYEQEAITEPSTREEWQRFQTMFVEGERQGRETSLRFLKRLVSGPFAANRDFREGLKTLNDIIRLCGEAGYSALQIRPDVTCVRGLEYYTGAVYECELTFPVTNERGETVTFGSVAGGGRYDGLVKRFTGQDVPATGFSIGVSRLQTALKNLGKLPDDAVAAPVLVTVMDRDPEALAGYQKLVQTLRSEGIRAEMYQGNPKDFGRQLKYADRRGCPVAIIQGSDERQAGEVQVKDLFEGKKLSAEIADNEAWRAARPAQVVAKVEDLVPTVRSMLQAQADQGAEEQYGG